MKSVIKSFLAATAPSLLEKIQRMNHARSAKKQEAQLQRVLAEVTRKSGLVVQSGPFQGMRYVDRINWLVFVPKLLGVYERELAGVTRQMLSAHYPVVVNIGCGEGYYAVGFARGSPHSKVMAYDIDPLSRDMCAEMAHLNGVSDRVVVRGECTHATLADDLTPHSLVICDCEGYELQLLDPEKCPALKDVDLLVELHEFAAEGLTEQMLSRFRATHEIEIIPAVAAGLEMAQGLDALSLEDRLYAVSEYRPPGMEWAVMMTRRERRQP